MSNFPILEINNKRRKSSDPSDIACMKHWYACHKTHDYTQGGNPCSVFGLCPEGERLNRLCPGYEPFAVTALDIFCTIAEIMERREARRLEDEQQAFIQQEMLKEEQ